MKKILLIIIAMHIALIYSSVNKAIAMPQIVAVVEDDIISKLDVENRVELTLLTSGMQASKKLKKQLFDQSLDLLINETIYRQRAEELEITISQTEINASIRQLEKQNNLPIGGFKNFLKNNATLLATAKEQIEAQLIRNKLIAQEVRSEVNVNDREIAEQQEKISGDYGAVEFLMSEIILSFSDPRDATRVRSFAYTLINKINAGADFTKLAREFSFASSAENGGRLEWLQESQIPQETFNLIRNLSNGNLLADPIREANSYRIIRLDDRRVLIPSTNPNDKVSFKQVFVELKSSMSPEKVKAISADIEKKSLSLSSCADFGKFAREVNSVVSAKTINTKLKNLNPAISSILSDLQKDETSQIVSAGSGLYLFMVCDKSSKQYKALMKDRLYNLLLNRKLELQAQDYLNNLRNSKFIEIRI